VANKQEQKILKTPKKKNSKSTAPPGQRRGFGKRVSWAGEKKLGKLKKTGGADHLWRKKTKKKPHSGGGGVIPWSKVVTHTTKSNHFLNLSERRSFPTVLLGEKIHQKNTKKEAPFMKDKSQGTQVLDLKPLSRYNNKPLVPAGADNCIGAPR